MLRPVEDLRDRLARVPDPVPNPSDTVHEAIAASVRYLGSDDALRSLDADTYWPKWNSPWWHMVVLSEVGEARRIPPRVVAKMAEGLNALPLKIFPIHPEDSPLGTDPHRDSSCHCALGSIHRVLTECGLDVARTLPWTEPWFARYQMADGGLSCDASAYLRTDECPSSMVGTIAPFEAMLAVSHGESSTAARRAFVDRAAQFLIGRELRLGSRSAHNAEERASASAWLQPCFPRLYFYDVVRGLRALVRWAEAGGGPIPLRAVSAVVEHLVTAFPDGCIRRQRRSYDGVTTILRTPSGEWVRRQRASSFALLEATSVLGEPCPFVTAQWGAARAGLLRLIEAGRVTADR